MPEADDVKERISRILTEELGPALGLDSAAIEVLRVADGVAQLRLGSVCPGCPSTLMTVIHGLEQELRRRIPEVRCLEVLP
jgi:Fe-S cluster biogenesis protein NfuA